MIDSNIAMGVKPLQIENPMNALAQMMQLKDAQQASQLNAMKMDEYQRGVTSQNALRQLLGGFGDDHSANQQKLMQGGYLKEAQDYGKNQADLGKTLADTQKTTADTDFKRIETAHKRIDAMGQAFGYVKDNPSAEAAMQATDYLVQNGIMSPEQAQATKAKIQADPSPQTIQKLAMQAYQSALSTKDQLPKLQNFNAGDRQVNQAVNPITGRDTETGSTPILQSADNAASQATQVRGQNMTDSRARAGQAQSASQHAATLGLQREKLSAPKRTGPMSVTLQKELLESDDVIQASGNAVNMLETAKKKNADAYSGYFAKGRAVLASNLPGATPGADATIDIDNLMTGQALENLKVIFGGMPTEGERKILMEMQASVDKTPKQREAIMDRGIAAAKRRGEYAKQKAKSIRSGAYLTEGMTEAADPLDLLLEKYK